MRAKVISDINTVAKSVSNLDKASDSSFCLMHLGCFFHVQQNVQGNFFTESTLSPARS